MPGFRKIRRKIGQTLGRRYVRQKNRPKGGLRVNRIVKDVKWLKSLVNAEKKRFKFSETDAPVGQLNCLDTNPLNVRDGSYIEHISCNPVQGAGYNQRNGASVKLHSSHLQFQITNQGQAEPNGIRGKVLIFTTRGQAVPAGAPTFAFRNEMFVGNQFITGAQADIFDYNSNYNPDFFRNWKMIKTKHFYLPPVEAISNITSGSDQYPQRRVLNFKMGMKYNNGKGMHVRWSKDTSTMEYGQLLIVIQVNRGNMSLDENIPAGEIGGVTAGTLRLNSGIKVSYNGVHYYYDN